MAQDTPIVDEPEIDPITNTVVVPALDVPISVTTPDPEPEPKPEPTPEPTPEPVTDPFSIEAPVVNTGISTAERQELDNFRSQQGVIDKDKSEIALAQQARTFEAQYLALGMDEQMARQVAQDMARVQIDANAQAQVKVDQAQAEQRFSVAKQNNVAELTEKYPGIDRNALLRFNTKDAMDAFAEERAARIADKTEYDKRLSLLEGKTVEDGEFDSAAAGSSMPLTPAQLLAKSGSDPNFEMTPEQSKLVNEHLGLLT